MAQIESTSSLLQNYASLLKAQAAIQNQASRPTADVTSTSNRTSSPQAQPNKDLTVILEVQKIEKVSRAGQEVYQIEALPVLKLSGQSIHLIHGDSIKFINTSPTSVGELLAVSAEYSDLESDAQMPVLLLNKSSLIHIEQTLQLQLSQTLAQRRVSQLIPQADDQQLAALIFKPLMAAIQSLSQIYPDQPELKALQQLVRSSLKHGPPLQWISQQLLTAKTPVTPPDWIKTLPSMAHKIVLEQNLRLLADFLHQQPMRLAEGKTQALQTTGVPEASISKIQLEKLESMTNSVLIDATAKLKMSTNRLAPRSPLTGASANQQQPPFSITPRLLLLNLVTLTQSVTPHFLMAINEEISNNTAVNIGISSHTTLESTNSKGALPNTTATLHSAPRHEPLLTTIQHLDPRLQQTFSARQLIAFDHGVYQKNKAGVTASPQIPQTAEPQTQLPDRELITKWLWLQQRWLHSPESIVQNLEDNLKLLPLLQGSALSAVDHQLNLLWPEYRQSSQLLHQLQFVMALPGNQKAYSSEKSLVETLIDLLRPASENNQSNVKLELLKALATKTGLAELSQNLIPRQDDNTSEMKTTQFALPYSQDGQLTSWLEVRLEHQKNLNDAREQQQPGQKLTLDFESFKFGFLRFEFEFPQGFYQPTCSSSIWLEKREHMQLFKTYQTQLTSYFKKIGLQIATFKWHHGRPQELQPSNIRKPRFQIDDYV